MALFSCNKDKSAPTVLIVQPEAHTNFSTGDMIHIEATFEDDKELASYSIFMGDENGNHASDFHYMESSSISGKSFEFHEHTMVPDSIGMVYYLHFQVTDAEDKTTSESVMLHFM